MSPHIRILIIEDDLDTARNICMGMTLPSPTMASQAVLDVARIRRVAQRRSPGVGFSAPGLCFYRRLEGILMAKPPLVEDRHH
jgi:hypothetical protein